MLDYNYWAEIHLERLQYNFNQIKKVLSSGVSILPVVKGNAYGHGIEEISKALVNAGAKNLAVGTVEEGIQLRKYGINSGIIILGYTIGKEELIVDHQLTPIISNIDDAYLLADAVRKNRTKISIQVRIDTGYGNVGVLPEDSLNLISSLSHFNCFSLDGIFTQLYAAYNQMDDEVDLQLKKFNSILKLIEVLDIKIPMIHAASSPAILNYPQSHYNTVRPGTILYGLPSLDQQDMTGFLPVMELKSKIIDIKMLPAGTCLGYGFKKKNNEIRLATIPIGYAHCPFLFNLTKGEILIRGKRASIFSRPQMEYFMVDVTDIPNVEKGDEVVILGQQGTEGISIIELTLNTNISLSHCELISLINPNVPRVYMPIKNEKKLKIN